MKNVTKSNRFISFIFTVKQSSLTTLFIYLLNHFDSEGDKLVAFATFVSKYDETFYEPLA